MFFEVDSESFLRILTMIRCYLQTSPQRGGQWKRECLRNCPCETKEGCQRPGFLWINPGVLIISCCTKYIFYFYPLGKWTIFQMAWFNHLVNMLCLKSVVYHYGSKALQLFGLQADFVLWRSRCVLGRWTPSNAPFMVGDVSHVFMLQVKKSSAQLNGVKCELHWFLIYCKHIVY